MQRKAKSSYPIVMVTRTVQWLRLPKDIRALIIIGQKRIERILREIRHNAKIDYLPPVRVLDYALRNGDNCVFGKAVVPIKIHDKVLIGIELAAPTAAFVDDEDVLRGILVHEIAHCFYSYYQEIVRDEEFRDESKENLDPNLAENAEIMDEAEHDKKVMVNPHDWFGEADANSLIHQQDESMRPALSRIENEWIDANLPVMAVNPKIINNFKGIPQILVDHVRHLLDKKKGQTMLS